MKTLYVDTAAFPLSHLDQIVERESKNYKATNVVKLGTELAHLLALSDNPPPGRLLTSVKRRHLWDSVKVEVFPWLGSPYRPDTDIRRVLLLWAGVPRDRCPQVVKNWDSPERSRKYREFIEEARAYSRLDPTVFPDVTLFPERDYKTVDDMEIEDFIRCVQGSPLAFDLETTGLSPLEDDIVGISYSTKAGTGRWIPCGNKIPGNLRIMLESPDVVKVTHNGKFDYAFLKTHGVTVKNIGGDTQLLGYLLQNSPSLALKNMAEQHLGLPVLRFEEVSTDKSFVNVDPKIAQAYACQDADITLRLHEFLLPGLDGALKNIYENVELPLIVLLAEMELVGMPVNLDKARELADRLESEVETLQIGMHQMVGDFNPDSNADISDILFNRLGLEPLTETKTGYSTDVWTLRHYDEVPFVHLLIEYKERTKLLSTYLRPLLAKGVKRVHANFNQTATATGRLSSSGPNLQNQAPFVRQIYQAEKGKLLIAADYSQQELRILAHVSQDPVLLDAYRTGKDLHDETAQKLGVPRRLAKNVNFGIPYGAGPDAIARQGRVSKAEAKAMLESHRREFPDLWNYIEKTKVRARAMGYSMSILGRRRILPNINAIGEQRAAAEREAVNMVIQGSAADMTKLAMVELSKVLPEGVTMISQVHDEIIFEVIQVNNIQSISQIIHDTMVGVMPLSVPMEVSVKWGSSWDQLK